MKKKVLFVATVDSHINSFHLPYLKYFKDNGYEVHVATNSNEKILYCDKKHAISINKSPYKFSNIKACKQLKKIINKEKFNLIHCHTPMGGVIARIAAKKARKNGTKVIYTAHGFHFYKKASFKNWLFYYPIEKYLSKYTDILITINKEDYNLAKNKFKKCNIKYIPGVGVDKEKFTNKLSNKEKNELKKELGLNEDDFVLIYLARLDKNKNQSLLIDIMKSINKKYPKIHLLLVGNDELNGKYQIQAESVSKNIHFLGYRNDIEKLLQISDLAVSSSIREGLPVNIIEAMMAGLPIVALNNRGTSALVNNDENGYIVNNKDEFMEKILFLYNDKNIRNIISKNNIFKSKKYQISSIIKQYINIYEGEDKYDK